MFGGVACVVIVSRLEMMVEEGGCCCGKKKSRNGHLMDSTSSWAVRLKMFTHMLSRTGAMISPARKHLKI